MKKFIAKRHAHKRLSFESLENRRLLSVNINWVNESSAGNGFSTLGDADLAKQIVNRAISDWEQVIVDLDYDNDTDVMTNNTINLTINVADLLGGRGQTDISAMSSTVGHPTWTAGIPIAANITLDDDGGGPSDNAGAGVGWFFDRTPFDDAEFTAIANSGSGVAYQGSFLDVNNSSNNYIDFYRTAVHEIGHAVGIQRGSASLQQPTRLNSFLTAAGLDAISFDQLYSFAGPNGVTATFTGMGGLHFYEFVHDNELMNPGRTIPGGNGNAPPNETTRQFISDLDVKVLADAYGYSVFLPSTINTSHVTLDSQTGTLLIQGGVTSNGSSTNETIYVETVSSNIRVQLKDSSNNAFATEFVPSALVKQIVISGNGGNDGTTYVDPALATLRKDVQWVVSSNQDAVDAGSLTDGFVDLDSSVPGRQIGLRAAIQNTNGTSGGSIYVPRGQYRLTRTGATGDSLGDLDISKSTNIIGTGAGDTIIDAGGDTGIGDRVFEVNASGSSVTLTLDSLTVTGGRAPANLSTGEMHGGGIFVRNGATLDLRNSAVVDNKTTNASEGIGGGIFFEPFAGHFITGSVITNNHSANFTGGVFLGGTSSGTSVLVTNSIIAGNTAAQAGSVDVGVQTGRSFTSGGKNRLGNAAAGFVHDPQGNGDIIGTPNYIVTGIADTFNHANDGVVRSLREAIESANTTAGAAEIWLPAWSFWLTRERPTGPQYTTDMKAEFGDLDIGYDGVTSVPDGSLTLRGVSNYSKVGWRPGAIADKVFELLGDYNSNTTVDTGDYVVWRNADPIDDPIADGNDDGTVDAADKTVRDNNYGNYFVREGVAVV
jgi:hypothetical protein